MYIDGYLGAFCRHNEQFNPYGLRFILVVLCIVKSEFLGSCFSTVVQKHCRALECILAEQITTCMGTTCVSLTQAKTEVPMLNITK